MGAVAGHSRMLKTEQQEEGFIAGGGMLYVGYGT